MRHDCLIKSFKSLPCFPCHCSIMLAYSRQWGSQKQSPFMVDQLHRSTSGSAVTSVQLTFVICTDGSILSHWVVFSFQARGDIWGLLTLAFPPTSRPHSCSCNEAEHHRYVREESFVWPPETSTQIFTSPITVYTSPVW